RRKCCVALGPSIVQECLGGQRQGVGWERAPALKPTSKKMLQQLLRGKSRFSCSSPRDAPNAQVKPHRAAGWGRWQALPAAWPGPRNDVGLNAMLGPAHTERMLRIVTNELLHLRQP